MHDEARAVSLGAHSHAEGVMIKSDSTFETIIIHLCVCECVSGCVFELQQQQPCTIHDA